MVRPDVPSQKVHLFLNFYEGWKNAKIQEWIQNLKIQ
jgi:hypothetical protein